jgi:hypothetical protein
VKQKSLQACCAITLLLLLQIHNLPTAKINKS